MFCEVHPERPCLPLRERWLARKGETEEGEIEKLQKCIELKLRTPRNSNFLVENPK